MEALHAPFTLRSELRLLPSAGDRVSLSPLGIMSTTPQAWELGDRRALSSKILGQQVMATEARLEGKV